MKTKPTVIVLRGGAPEKVNLSGVLYDTLNLDNVNLRDLDLNYIKIEIKNGSYFLPSDEGDYEICKSIEGAESNILLGKTKDGILPQYLVRKNSPIYEEWNLHVKSIKYPNTEFMKTSEVTYIPNKVYKSTYESGSRGVIVNPSELELAEFLNNHKNDEVILVQDTLTPSSDSMNFTFDFQIKNGELLGYSWVNIPAGTYPRWLKGQIVAGDLESSIVTDVYKYFTEIWDITDGFYNIDGIRINDTYYLYEVNFRYSGIGNVLRCMNIDIIQNYLYNLPYKIPDGVYNYSYAYIPVLLDKSNSNYMDLSNKI